MKQGTTLDRRTFTVEAALALLSGVAITVSACGGGSSPTNPNPNPTPTPAPAPTPTPSPTPTPATTDKNGSISANHGHVATITAVRLSQGGAFDLDIMGQADHNHTVRLSAADMTGIAANQRVSRESTDNNSHSHTVTFN